MPAQGADEQDKDSDDLSFYHLDVVCVRMNNTEAQKQFEEKLQHLISLRGSCCSSCGLLLFNVISGCVRDRGGK